MRIDHKEIDFYKYCKTCKNRKTKEHEDPCHECLNNPMGVNSTKPIRYEKCTQKKQRL